MSENRSQSLTLVFAHGWAMSDWFWEPLAAELGDFQLRSLPQAYFARETQNTRLPAVDPNADLESGWVGIGHSFGFRRLLESQWENCRGLVSICGFYDFVVPAGTDARVVGAMVRRFGRSPKTVLKRFVENCGLAELAQQKGPAVDSEADLNRDLLLADLEALQAVSPPDQGPSQIVAPILSLAANHDKIVPVELTRSEFKQPVFHPTAEHGLGHQHAGWCATHIREFLNSL